MSQYASIRTRIKDKNVLINCLKEMGYKVEEGHNLALYDYLGSRRPQGADIVIRRDQLSGASNDLGFKLNGDYYEIIISNYDSGARNGSKIKNEIERKSQEIEAKMREMEKAVKRKYADEKIRKMAEEMKKQGFKLRKRNEKGKQIVYEFVRLT